MSERTRHAAELAARLQNARPLKYRGDVRTGATPGQVARDVDKLLRLAGSLSGLALRQCNDPRADFNDDLQYGPIGREAKRRERLCKAVADVLAPYGLAFDNNNDPRGYALYIHFPDGAYNTIGGRETGWGV